MQYNTYKKTIFFEREELRLEVISLRKIIKEKNAQLHKIIEVASLKKINPDNFVFHEKPDEGSPIG